MSKIHELLLSRRKEVLAEIAPLKAELKEIDTALSAISGEMPSAPLARIGPRSGSINSSTLVVLRDHPEGLRTRAVAKAIHQRFNREITPRNMSWHLSHLKRDKRVVLIEGVWSILGSTNEAPGDPAPEDSRQALEGPLD